MFSFRSSSGPAFCRETGGLFRVTGLPVMQALGLERDAGAPA
jgi:hypothetical protein